MSPQTKVTSPTKPPDDRLAELGLTADILRESLEEGWRVAADCTKHDPPNLPGIIVWGKTIRHLRDRLVPAGWRSNNTMNYSTSSRFPGFLKLCRAEVQEMSDRRWRSTLSGGQEDKTDSFTPSRLELARRRRGITKKDLAAKAGVPLRTLQAYMRGDQEPTDERVQTFARVLAFPPRFFSGPDVEELPLDAVSFRALSKLTARQRDRELASAEIALEFSRWIDERFRLPEPAVPRLEDLDPENAAAAARREFGLGEQPVRHMIHLLEGHGVRVFSLAEESTAVDAFSFSLGQVPYMFLDTTKSAERTRLDAAHELGHLVMHWGEATPRGREEEQEAQRFAAAFLMPSSSVLAEAPRGAHLSQIIGAKRRWGVSASALTVRMHRLGLLTDWQYRSLMIEISRRGLRTQEEAPIAPEGSQVWSKVFEVMRGEGMSPASIASELLVPSEELNKIVFGLVLTGVEGAGVDAVDERRRSFRLVKGDAS